MRVAYQKIVTPDYFRAMGMPLLKGRGITPQDLEGAPPVVVVNETFVKRLLGAADPIGRRLADNQRHTIVGVVGDARDLDLEKEAQPQVYYSHRQRRMMQTRLVIRTRSDPADQAGAIRAVIRSVEKDRPILSLRTMQERIDSSVMPQRFQTALAGLSAAISLILAAVGIYGVVNCSVAQRVHELGIRMALGASESDVLKGVLRQGLQLAGAGIGIGLAGAFALTRVIASLLYGVQSTDAATFVCVSLLVAAVALLACYLPARRAARTDPIAALRYE
jgi:putative ABC transport system permease protein